MRGVGSCMAVLFSRSQTKARVGLLLEMRGPILGAGMWYVHLRLPTGDKGLDRGVRINNVANPNCDNDLLLAINENVAICTLLCNAQRDSVYLASVMPRSASVGVVSFQLRRIRVS